MLRGSCRAHARPAAARHAPNDVLMCIDVENAFGAVRWADALLAAVAAAPRLAVPMAMMWRCFAMAVYMRDVDGHGWHSFLIYGSVIQGNLEGQPAFCLVIAVVLHVVVAAPRVQAWRPVIKHWLYIDDWTMQMPLAAAGVLLFVCFAESTKEKRGERASKYCK